MKSIFLALVAAYGVLLPSAGYASPSWSGGGVFRLSGTHSSRGPYTGELEVRPGANSVFQVIRTITYSDFRFEGFQVQELWVGTASGSDDVLKAHFTLKRADVFNRVDGVERTREQFAAPLVLEGQYTSGAGPAWTLPDGTETDTLGEIVRPVPAAPSWADERRLIPSFGNHHFELSKIAEATVLRPVFQRYYNDPFVQTYKTRPEFQSRMQYFVVDSTDYGFLQSNLGVVRVTNKVVDSISLVEAGLKRDAYGPTLDQKADEIESRITKEHLNSLGIVEIGVVDGSGRPAGRVLNNDGALWTGMYGAAEAIRWKLTNDIEALESFRKVVRGMFLLMDVTGDSAEFARGVKKTSELTPFDQDLIPGAAPYNDVVFRRGGNNDMLKGLLVTFAWAFEVLPSGDPLLGEVALHVMRLRSLRAVSEFNHPRNWLMALGLEAIATRDPARKDAYLSYLNTTVNTVSATGFDNGFFYGGIADWSGINLGVVARMGEILVANGLVRAFPHDLGAMKALADARVDLMSMWEIYAGSRRDPLTFAATALAVGDGAFIGFPAVTRATPKNPALWQYDLELGLWGLREVPIPRTLHDATFDLTLRPDWSISAWPRLPWKDLFGTNPVSDLYQGAYQFPIFESNALAADNYWTAAFLFNGASSRQVRFARTDYLFGYWLARMAGLISPPRAVPAF